MVESLRKDILCAFIDGSFENLYGMARQCIIGDNSITKGVSVCRISIDAIGPTRCELDGMYMVVRMVQCIIEYYGINNGTITIGTSCENGLKRTFQKTT